MVVLDFGGEGMIGRALTARYDRDIHGEPACLSITS